MLPAVALSEQTERKKAELGNPLKSVRIPFNEPFIKLPGVWCPSPGLGLGGDGLCLKEPWSRPFPISTTRWPRTLAGITAYQSCLQYPFTSVPLSGGAPGTRASRRCDRAGRWEPGDYSHCLYTNDITRVLYTFVLVRLGHPQTLIPGIGWDGARCLVGEAVPQFSGVR